MAHRNQLDEAPATEEVDLWWGGYDGRAMLPSFTICAVLTLAIIGCGWLIWTVWAMEGLKAYLVRMTIYGLILLVWLIQLYRWGHRLMSFNYRLTTRRLSRSRGYFFRHDRRDLWLTDIHKISVQPLSTFHWSRVGNIRIELNDAGQRPMTLEGVHDPERIATAIRVAMERARVTPPTCHP